MTTTQELAADPVDVRGSIRLTADRYFRHTYDDTAAPAELVDKIAAAVERYVGTGTPDVGSHSRELALAEELETAGELIQDRTRERDEARAERDSAIASAVEETSKADRLRSQVYRLVLAATEEFQSGPDVFDQQVDEAEKLISQTLPRFDQHRYVVDEDTGEPGECGCSKPYPRLDNGSPDREREAIEWLQAVGVPHKRAHREPHYWHLIDGEDCVCVSTEDGEV